MPKKGLLQKTLDIHKEITLAETADRNSGISPEDRIEITAQIDELTRKNRIDLTPERLVLQPLKKGFLFPLAVNVLALLVTGGALWGLSAMFSERDARYSQTGAALASAEGKLIQELKKDSESRLSEKDKEINDFQARLAAMEKEQSKLQAGFEERLTNRETELRSLMETELRKERERLVKEGLSKELIEERLKKFEEERLVSIKKELLDFKSQLDAERTAAEANYAKLRDEFKNNISSLNADRKRIQDESKKREDALRSSLEAKTLELENQTQALASQAAQATAGLQQAQAELGRLTEQRNKAAAAEDQIIGLYLSVRAALQDDRYEDAAKSASSLQSYLMEPGLAEIPALQKRRPADLFASDTLSRLARTELERANIDNTLLLDQAELVSSIRSLTSRAGQALAGGNGDQADELYTQALSVVPEVMEAYSYFAGKTAAAGLVGREQAASALLRAETAASGADYLLAAAAYGEASAFFGLSETESERLVDGISALAVASQAAEQRSVDTRIAQTLMNRAKKEFDSSRWSQSLATYSQVISGNPRADQVPDALKGISASFAGLAKEAEAKAKDDEKKLAGVQAALAAAGSTATVTAARIAELELMLTEARLGTAAAAGSTATGTSGAADSRTVDAALRKDIETLRAENATLAAAAKKYDTLLGAYGKYRIAEDAALSNIGSAGIVDARTQLDAFLTGTETRRAFPDLKERIARYEKEFIAAGQKESLYNAMTIAENALRLKDAATRENYFRDIQSRYEGDTDMLAYITALKRGLR